MKTTVSTQTFDHMIGSIPNRSPASTSHILFVEDDPDLAAALEDSFRDDDSADFMIKRAPSLEAAITLLGLGEIDVILLDLNLPDSRGLETFSKIQRIAPALPVIILSGLADEALAIEMMRAGAQDYVVKGTMSISVLVRAVKYALERKQLQRQLADYAWQLRIRNDAMRAELELARDIQRAYLPLGDADFPRNAAASSALLHVHSRYQPTDELGGDFFDILEVSETEVGILICDVMGHGVCAGLVAGILRGLIEEARPWAGDAGLFLSELNSGMRAVLSQRDGLIFATAFYLIADLAKKELRYANAGHPCPIFRDELTGEVGSLSWRPGEQCAALGLFDHTPYSVTRREMQPTDLFILFTDGLCEASRDDGTPFGIDRLKDVAREQGRRPIPELFDFMLAGAKAYSNSETFEDDVCILGIQMLAGAVDGKILQKVEQQPRQATTWHARDSVHVRSRPGHTLAAESMVLR